MLLTQTHSGRLILVWYGRTAFDRPSLSFILYVHRNHAH